MVLVTSGEVKGLLLTTLTKAEELIGQNNCASYHPAPMFAQTGGSMDLETLDFHCSSRRMRRHPYHHDALGPLLHLALKPFTQKGLGRLGATCKC
jgi:hypothetical protein